MPELGSTVVVFDLDDTIYAERDYQTSGIKAVCSILRRLYHRDLENELLKLRNDGCGNLWQQACELLQLPSSAGETMLWMYRLHIPDVRLSDAARNVIDICEKHCRAIAILTDGRAVTQRLKIEALGLSHVPCYISEEYGSVKPEDARFHLIMNEYPAEQYVYIADNPVKDFIAPNALGWITIGVKLQDYHIHRYDMGAINEYAMPNHWVKSLDDIGGLLGAI
jgi:putative hydrolase of the HAD superfamily